MSWCLDALKKYAVFSGRSRRKEYWNFVLFNIIVGIVLLVFAVMGGTPGNNRYDPNPRENAARVS